MAPKAKMPVPVGNKKGQSKALKQKVLQYMDKGLSAEESYCIANPGHTPTKRLMQMYRKEHQTLLLTNPILVEAAQNVIADTLDGIALEVNGELIAPTHSNRLQAAQMVLDRAEPIIKINQNLNINAECSVVDLSRYLNKN